MRLLNFKGCLALSVFLVALPAAALAARNGTASVKNTTSAKKKSATKSDPSVKFKLFGFVSTTGFWQDQQFLFGNGQNAELPLPKGPGTSSRSGIDVRNTRVWLTVSSPDLAGGWNIGGRIEADFFGGFNGSGPYSSSQETPRLRQAYFTVKSPNGRTSVQVGQQWELIFPIKSVPKSLTHIAFPLGFATGMIGWRFPGVVLHQYLNNPQNGGAAVRLDVGIFSGQWDGPGSNTNFDTAGNVGFRPQYEARLNVSDGDWDFYGAGYYSSQNLEDMPAGAPSHSTLSSWVAELGGAWHPGPWSLVAAIYDGRAIGQIFGAMAQFGDIEDHGGFVQGGYSFTKHWHLYASYSIDKPNTDDVIRWMKFGSSGRLKGQQGALDLIYTSGPFGVGVEFMHAILRETTNGKNRLTNVGNQVSVSGIYHF